MPACPSSDTALRETCFSRQPCLPLRYYSGLFLNGAIGPTTTSPPRRKPGKRSAGILPAVASASQPRRVDGTVCERERCDFDRGFYRTVCHVASMFGPKMFGPKTTKGAASSLAARATPFSRLFNLYC